MGLFTVPGALLTESAEDLDEFRKRRKGGVIAGLESILAGQEGILTGLKSIGAGLKRRMFSFHAGTATAEAQV